MRTTWLLISACLLWSAPAAAAGGDVERGKYLIAAGGCVTCHTDAKNKGAAFAGGRALKTPFGTFYGPNITPDPKHGIGRWSESDFVRAMREGVSPDGRHYYPVFPYPSFTGITDADLSAMFAYLRTIPPVDQANRPHDVGFPFSMRFLQSFWKELNVTEGPLAPDPSKSPQWNRGAYLAKALVHCGECHTPRNAMGALERDRWLAGTADGPEGEAVPNITPDPETGIGRWSADELATYLSQGMDPDGDFAGSLMADVVDRSTGKLTPEDLAAIVVYIRSVSPIRNRIGRSK